MQNIPKSIVKKLEIRSVAMNLKISTKTLIVGDLHGRYELVEAALNTDYNIVFIGDYLDSFDRSKEDQVKTLDLVLNSIKEEPQRVTGLLGNHELSYLHPKMICSGWNQEMQSIINLKDLSPLKNYIWVDDYLVSHAGVSRLLLEMLNKTLDEYLDEEDFFQIGYARGGWSTVGGLFWNDWFKEFEPLENTPQIVGHSGYRPGGEGLGILRKNNSYNVDNFDKTKEFLLLKKDKEPEILNLLELTK